MPENRGAEEELQDADTRQTHTHTHHTAPPRGHTCSSHSLKNSNPRAGKLHLLGESLHHLELLMLSTFCRRSPAATAALGEPCWTDTLLNITRQLRQHRAVCVQARLPMAAHRPPA